MSHAEKPTRATIGQGLNSGLIGHLFAFRLRAARLAIRRDLDRRLGPIGISPIQFALLDVIRHNPGVQTGALADALYLDRSTVVQALALLARTGLVVRRAAAPTGRARGAWLTASGEVLRARAEELVRQQERLLATVLSADERQTLEALLERISSGRFRPRPGSRGGAI